MEERVQKVLSQWGVASRRQAEKMILAGRVRLNGNLVQLGQKVNLETEKLEVDGKLLQRDRRPPGIYLLLYKPAGVVSTCFDPQNRPTILDLLPDSLRSGQGLHPVGRLDADSTGALLLTNEGAMTLALTHPRYHLPKTYQVWVQGHPSPSVLQLWRDGIFLAGKKTLPAKVKVISTNTNTLLEVVLTEGRNRQIRRVAKALGYPVIGLHRTAIGSIPLQLPGEPLLPGQYRFLKNFEISFLQNQVNQTEPADDEEYEYAGE